MTSTNDSSNFFRLLIQPVLLRMLIVVVGMGVLTIKVLVFGHMHDQEILILCLCLGLGNVFLFGFHTVQTGYGLDVRKKYMPYMLAVIHLLGFILWLSVYYLLWTQVGNPDVKILTLVNEAFLPTLVQVTIGLVDWFIFCEKQKFFASEKVMRGDLEAAGRSPSQIADEIRKARQNGLFGPLT